MAQMGFKIDLSRCVGCRACEVACKQEQNTVGGVRYRQVIEQEAGTYPVMKRLYFTTACHHCAAPACMAACPKGAITKNAFGLVLIDQDKCVGCRYCAAVCPYGAPQYNAASGKTEKCTLCVSRVLTPDRSAPTGWEPACVATCIGKALEFVPDVPAGSLGTPPSRFADPRMTRPSLIFEWGAEEPW